MVQQARREAGEEDARHAVGEADVSVFVAFAEVVQERGDEQVAIAYAAVAKEAADPDEMRLIGDGERAKGGCLGRGQHGREEPAMVGGQVRPERAQPLARAIGERPHGVVSEVEAVAQNDAEEEVVDRGVQRIEEAGAGAPPEEDD